MACLSMYFTTMCSERSSSFLTSWPSTKNSSEGTLSTFPTCCIDASGSIELRVKMMGLEHRLAACGDEAMLRYRLGGGQSSASSPYIFFFCSFSFLLYCALREQTTRIEVTYSRVPCAIPFL